MVHSHLYGRSNLCKDIPFARVESNDGVDVICKHVHKRDPLSIISTAYSDFMHLLSTRRGQNETCRNFESRFAVAVAKLKSHARNALPEF